MKVSYNWLQTHIEEKLPPIESLKEMIIFHAFEVEDIESVGDDTVMDIKVLPDRAGDCLSHYGVAREIAGLLNLTLKQVSYSLPTIELALPVEIKSDVCRRYIAIQMNDVTVGASPAWLVERLAAVGQRSINNIVDATNFVLLDSGQPTHVYDRAKIDGGIIVRSAKDGEKIITLSDEEKLLKPENVVIADYMGALAIAGIKGGKSAEIEGITVDEDGGVIGHQSSFPTRSIVLEIANFEPASVRKTARSLNLVTDAAKRFENDFSPATALAVAGQLAVLIKDIAGGEIVGVYDTYPHPVEVRTLSFTIGEITRLLGSTVTGPMISKVFDQYGYTNTVIGDTFTLTIPLWRRDIVGAHDVAEEVGRVIGYDTIPTAPLPFTPTTEVHPVFATIRAVKAYLTARGFSEVITYVFRKRGDIEVARGPKGKSALRTNLSEGLQESYELNRLNAPILGLQTIKLFEIGAVFPLSGETIHVATIDNGMIQELPLEQFITEHQIDTNAPIVAPLIGTQVFKSWSSYPFITRDIAVWIAVSTDQAVLQSILSAFATEYCVRTPVLIDTFTKEGRISVAYRLIFQAIDRTLTNDEVEKIFATLVQKIKANTSFEIR